MRVTHIIDGRMHLCDAHYRWVRGMTHAYINYTKSVRERERERARCKETEHVCVRVCEKSTSERSREKEQECERKRARYKETERACV